MATVERGFLLLADLTGYTAYLARGELAHAPVIAGDLLETVVGRLEPPFRLAKLEGDAAFLFAEDGRAEPALLLDAIVASYLAFRRRLRSIEAASACDCTACALAPRLDLKAFVHHGDYLRSTIAGRDELSGADVIVAHRLLKGAGAASAAGRGFVLFTEPAAEALGLDASRRPSSPASESIEHLGDVATLHPRPRGAMEGRDRGAADRRHDGPDAVRRSRRPRRPARRRSWAPPDLARRHGRLGGPARDHGDARRRDARRRAAPRAASRAGWRRSRRSSTGRRTSTSAGASPCPASVRSRRATTSSRSAAGRGSRSAGVRDAADRRRRGRTAARLDTEAALGRLRQVVGRGIAVLQGAEVTR